MSRESPYAFIRAKFENDYSMDQLKELLANCLGWGGCNGELL